MAKYLSIQIPNPCSEKAENMLPSEKGSYCRSCKKEVIDFTEMTDTAVAVFFTKVSGEICGRFLPDQLGHDILLPKKKLSFVKYLVTVALPAILFGLKAGAQSYTRSPHRQIISKLHKNASPAVTIPLPSIPATNSAEIRQPEFTYAKPVMMMMGSAISSISVTTTYVGEERSVPRSLDIYPNPAAGNAPLNFKLSGRSIGPKQTVQIFSSAGMLLQKDVIRLDKNVGFVTPGNLPKGHYILMVIDGTTGKPLSGEFLVQ